MIDDPNNDIFVLQNQQTKRCLNEAKLTKSNKWKFLDKIDGKSVYIKHDTKYLTYRIEGSLDGSPEEVKNMILDGEDEYDEGLEDKEWMWLNEENAI